MNARQMLLAAGMATMAIAAGPLPAVAGGALVGSGFAVFCDGGQRYLLAPRAVTDAGEVIIGTLRLSPHRSASLRLIPMGQGYRYAGAGVWLDGIRDQAVLYRGERGPVACTVAAL